MSSVKGDELVKYITERVVNYMDTPKEVRKQQQQRGKEPWILKWFGYIPYSLHLWLSSKVRPTEKEAPPSSKM